MLEKFYNMTGKSLKLQQIIITSLRNIDFLNENNINVFSSVPTKKHLPYAKIFSISLNKSQNSCNIKTFTIDIFVATNWKDNQMILKIMDNIDENIANQISETISSNAIQDLSIYNIYNNHYDVKEDLQNNTWFGHFYFDIDVI